MCEEGSKLSGTLPEDPEGVARLLSTLGLCARARKLTFGIPMTCEAMKKGGSGAPVGVFEAADTSENSHKRISDRCRFYGVPLYRLPVDGERLAAAVGKSAALGAVGVTDKGLLGAVTGRK